MVTKSLKMIFYVLWLVWFYYWLDFQQ